jgi:hypothetical protein
VTVCTFLDDEIYSKCFCSFCSYSEGDMLSICVSSLTAQTSGTGTTIRLSWRNRCPLVLPENQLVFGLKFDF